MSNLIRSKGEHSYEFGDDWPVWYRIECQTLVENHSKLIELIDPINGLLDEMFSAKCINNWQRHCIEMGVTDEIQNLKIVECVFRGSLAKYNTFIDCLQQTKQHQVVSLSRLQEIY